jgi:outer membrane protein assembly factor BamB
MDPDQGVSTYRRSCRPFQRSCFVALSWRATFVVPAVVGRSALFLSALFLFAAATIRTAATDWPQWRGPDRTGRTMWSGGKLESLPDTLQPLWHVKAGEGFSGSILVGDRLIYTGADGETETLFVLDAANGKELWRRPYAAIYRDEWGSGPRASPFSDGERIYVQSCRGDFCAFELSGGKLLWKTSFEKDFGVPFLGSKAAEGTASRRGNNGAGLADGDGVIVPVGSTEGASLVCFDKRSGRVVWKSGDDEAAYAALMIGMLVGVKQILHINADALVGVERATGRLLWRVPLKTTAKRHIATPVIAAGDHVLVNSHTFGIKCFQIRNDAGRWSASEVWNNAKLKVNLATPVVAGDHLYTHGASKDFICVNALTGELKWSQPGFGRDYSSTIGIGDRLLVLSDTGQLRLVAADPSGYHEFGTVQVCGKTWNFPVFADGRLFVRDARGLACFNLASGR